MVGSELSLSLKIKPSIWKGYGNDRLIRLQIRREQNIQKVKMGIIHQDDPSCRLLDNRFRVLDNFSLSARVTQMGSIRQDGPFLWDTETLWKGICSHGTLYSYVKGNECKDIVGAWDWNLVPGTTTLLNQPKL